MRVERLSTHKFKIFLTSDDLMERGLEKEEIWKDLPRVHQIFSDMMLEAQEELGEELAGVLTVQIYLLQAQGMLVVVTKSEESSTDEDDFLEMKVTLDEHRELMYRFEDIEDVISVTKTLHRLGMTGGTLYSYDHSYYLILEDFELEDQEKDDVIALLSEFGGASTMTSVWLQEYGVRVAFRETVEKFHSFF
ncbi:genetic competence negative regulator [Salimicrobium halophilum]|uniref:Adapter protein MecA 1/2 n=1 Tax=Salimicrobium halophilum TaxID=86666 RepID=A0A1G8PYY5_9BACI|nr:genetic competence negative regulator [Salimicrobium halophilum]SDI97702.1 adapter protein MecA 1/2 [Salimicrobium halophilum]